jgi:hypothetical protein
MPGKFCRAFFSVDTLRPRLVMVKAALTTGTFGEGSPFRWLRISKRKRPDFQVRALRSDGRGKTLHGKTPYHDQNGENSNDVSEHELRRHGCAAEPQRHE